MITPVKSSIGIIIHQGHISQVNTNVVDRPTQLIHIGISIGQHTSTKDIAGQSANTNADSPSHSLTNITSIASCDGKYRVFSITE